MMHEANGNIINEAPESDFHHLTPDLVLDMVETALGARCSNICRPLNSYINRVYEVFKADGEAVIVKFYRPGRWSRDALRDEHDFLLELQAFEVPVIAPLLNADRQSVHEANGMYFALFPKKGGRICDEFDEQQWRELGRLIARVHVVGAEHAPRDRVRWHPLEATERHLATILAADDLLSEFRSVYEDTVRGLIADMTPLFEDLEEIRLHGDCHHQNIIYRPNESFFVIDFDDMATGPAAQDVWMLLPGRLRDVLLELDWFLDSYEMFRDFDRASLRLVEPLRTMRYVHFTAWCVRQAADGGFKRLEPSWGSRTYWQREVDDLKEQEEYIRNAEQDAAWM